MDHLSYASLPTPPSPMADTPSTKRPSAARSGHRSDVGAPETRSGTEKGGSEAPPGADPRAEGSTSRKRISRRARSNLRDLHQRTWELEMLVSGALAFLLFQVPARVDQLWFRVDPLVSGSLGLAAFMAYYYVKLILYTLIACLAFHLATRAFWVALVGLDSVYPRGIAWRKVAMGPNTERVYRSILPSVREMIVTTDAVASVVFAGAAAVVGIFVVSILGAGLLAGVTASVVALSPWEVEPGTIFGLAAVVFALGVSGPAVLDRYVGRRLDPDSAPARLLRALLAVQVRLLGLRYYGSIQYTLSSRIGSTRAAVALTVFLVSLIAFFLAKDVFIGSGRAVWAATGYFPDRGGAAQVNPRYYERYQDPDGMVFPMPSLPSEVLGADEVVTRLFVPLDTEDDPEALARLCPGLEPVQQTGPRLARPWRGVLADSLQAPVETALACLAQLWTVEVDGNPVGEPPVFARHAVHGVPGLAWYVDVRELAPGRHVLSVTRNPAADADAEPDGRGGEDDDEPSPPTRHEILFWR